MTFETRLRRELHDHGDRLRVHKPPPEQLVRRRTRRRVGRLAAGLAAVVVVTVVGVTVAASPPDIEIGPVGPDARTAEPVALYVLDRPSEEAAGEVLRVATADGDSRELSVPGTAVTMALSPDGGLLAVVTVEDGVYRLLGVETVNGETQVTWSLPSGPMTAGGPTASSAATFNPDGEHVHLLLREEGTPRANDVRFTTFEIASGIPRPATADLAECGVGAAHSVDANRVAVFCPHTNDLRWLQLDDGIWRPTRVAVPAEPSTERSRDGNDLGLDRVWNTALDRTHRRLYLLTGDGQVATFDLRTGELGEMDRLDLPDGSYLPRNSIAVAPGGARLYVGIGPLVDRVEQTGRMQATRVAVVDTTTWETVAVVDLDAPATELVAGSAEVVYLVDSGAWSGHPSIRRLTWPSSTITTLTTRLHQPAGVTSADPG